MTETVNIVDIIDCKYKFLDILNVTKWMTDTPWLNITTACVLSIKCLYAASVYSAAVLGKWRLDITFCHIRLGNIIMHSLSKCVDLSSLERPCCFVIREIWGWASINLDELSAIDLETDRSKALLLSSPELYVRQSCLVSLSFSMRVFVWQSYG